MTTEFILAQICGFVVLLLMVASVWFNDNKKIVLISVFANIFATAQYFLLSALTGAIISIINVVRCLVFYMFKKKGLKPSVIVLVLFEVVAVVSGAITWQNWWSIIPILMACIYTFGLWQDNTFVIKLSTGIVGAGWVVYNIVVRAYIGAVQQFAQFVSSVVAIAKDKIEQKKVDVSSSEKTQIDQDIN